MDNPNDKDKSHFSNGYSGLPDKNKKQKSDISKETSPEETPEKKGKAKKEKKKLENSDSKELQSEENVKRIMACPTITVQSPVGTIKYKEYDNCKYFLNDKEEIDWSRVVEVKSEIEQSTESSKTKDDKDDA